MKLSHVLSIIVLAGLLGAQGTARAEKTVVGVSWSSFRVERWKHDQAAMKAAIERAGGTYLSTDAKGTNEQQTADIEGLIARGAKVLVVLAWDADALLPAIKKAEARGIPVIAYDRLIQDKDVFFITFDNVEVGRMQAREVLKVVPAGSYAFIKGAKIDLNSDLLHKGQLEVLDPAIKSGKIKIVGDQYTEGWAPPVAQKNMEQILGQNDDKVDAVIASNDGTAGGVVVALQAHHLAGVAVSGQDGDIAALARVARGEQTVTVWKDARKLGDAAGTVAMKLARGAKPGDIAGAVRFTGGDKKIGQSALLLKPVPITADNLDLVIKAGWAARAQVCSGVTPARAPPACK
jgi:D-xylose transport system substrate-binding protein